MKKTFYSELTYVLGQIILTLGAALIRTSGFGVSMVVAPAYLIADFVPFLSVGQAEYTFQAALLLIFCLIVRRFRVKYLLSFVTAFIYGHIIDGYLALLALGAPYPIALRIAFFILGDVFTVAGVTFFFKTYVPPEVYELFVKGLSERFGFDMGRVKWAYDLSSLAFAAAISFLFFGELRYVWFGTAILALINGPLISRFSRFLDDRFDFRPFFRVPAWLG